MNCPNCDSAMSSMTLEGHIGPPVTLQVCVPCQGFWFEMFKSLQLAPGSTLKLMKFIGENSSSARTSAAEILHCPVCRDKLLLTHDWQRNTPFTYWRCDREHGHYIVFFDFLREKDYIRPLSPQEITKLRENIQVLNCHNCGAPIDLAKGSSCEHCHSPVSMLDMQQPQRMLAQLKGAASRTPHFTQEFSLIQHLDDSDYDWWKDVSSFGLIQVGLNMVARWLSRIAD
ncbi:MAG: hypothetical protein JWO20_1952 [Candidatus Angelobacter sp.]|nr:hypothetical protein [Candidatus Angelobacter sp.]